MTSEDVLNILKDRSYNLEMQKKRIILLALIKTYFIIEQAYLINIPDRKKFNLSFWGYRREVYRMFPGGIKTLKEAYYDCLQIQGNKRIKNAFLKKVS